MTNESSDYNERTRQRLRFIFEDRAKQVTEYHFGKSASSQTATSVQLLLLLAQKVNYLTAKRIEEVKGIYDLHEYVPYEKLRTEAGRQTIDELLSSLSAHTEALLLELTPDHNVLFTAIYPNQTSPVLRVRDVLIGMDDSLARFIKSSGKGEQLTPKCLIV